MTDGENEDDSWPLRLGISDEPSGQAVAAQGRTLILSAIRDTMNSGPIFFEHMIFAGMATRAQSLHEAAVATCDAGNPHATFTLIRAAAEQVAAMIFTLDHPDKAKRLWSDPDGPGIPVGRLTNYAQRSGRAGNFRSLYGVLSRYAHPSAAAHFAGIRTGEGRTINWASAPRFKHPDDQLAAYGWIFEIAEMSASLLREYAGRADLIERQKRAIEIHGHEGPNATDS